MTSLVSGRFRMPQRRMIGYLYSRYGRRWTIGLTVVTVGLAATAVATWDIRWAVCALMVILLIAPVVIAWLYLQFALDPECAFNVLDHRIELQGGGLEVAVWPKRPAPDPESEKESLTEDMPEEASREDNLQMEDEDIPVTVRRIGLEEIGEIRIGGDYVVVAFGRRGFLYVPLSAFANVEEMQEFLQGIKAGTS